jgi:hypothetical protein
MLSASQPRLVLLAVLLVAPSLCLASSITLNGACEAGTCPPVGSLAPGGSIPATLFNFIASVNGDMYDIFGEYSASNTTSSPSGFTATQFNVTADYMGPAPTTGADALTIDDLQDFTVPGTFSLTGTYNESTFATFGGSGGSLTYQAFYNGDGLGLLGPVTSPQSLSSSKDLMLTGTSLDVEAQYTLVFDAGTTRGSEITSTPEPTGLVPATAILALCLGVSAIRRSRIVSKL